MRKFTISTFKRQYKELCASVLILFLLFAFQLNSTAQCSMSCKGINISIDGTACEADIRPSDVLTEACVDATSYTIVINDHHGNFVIEETGLAFSTPFMWMNSGTFAGEEVQIQVVAVGVDGQELNSCWNTALIEDKKPPVLNCDNPNIQDTIILKCCDGADIPTALMRSAFEECSDFEIVVLEQSERAADCETESNYTRVIEIEAYGIDEFGNRSVTCDFYVFVERLFPELTMIPALAPELCEDTPMLDMTLLVCPDTLLFAEGDAINCADIDDYVTITLNTSVGPIQVPAPIPLSEGGSGVPKLIKDVDPDCAVQELETVYLRTMDSGHPDAIDLLANCNVGVSYTDLYLGSTNCVTKIRRTWFIREWHCADEGEIICNQMIEIADTQAPVVLDSLPGFEATTNGFDCHATITLPNVQFTDDCGNVDHIDVIHPLGILRNFDKASEVQRRISLPEGVDTLIYRAYDKCHNTTDYQIVISVWDNTPPVPICDDNLVVSLTFNGAAEVRSSSFDDGSYDDCALKTTLVRKMNPDNCDCSLHPPKFDDFKELGMYEGHLYYLSDKPVIRAKAIQLGVAFGGYLAAVDGNIPDPEGEDSEEGIKISEAEAAAITAESEWIEGRVASFFDPVPGYHTSPIILTNTLKPDIIDFDVPDSLYVIEIESPCGFSNSIHFCCGDLGEEETMVVVRAIDKWGNFNECMVSVELQDKSQPEIVCPPNLSLACEFDGVDVANLDVFFGTIINGGQLDALNGFALTGSGSSDSSFIGFYPGENPHGTSVDTANVVYFSNGYAIDNCAESLIIEELPAMDMRDQCGRGDIIRKFIAYNPGQKEFATDPCEQILSFEATSEFELENIDATPLLDSIFCVTDLDFCVDISSNTENLFPSSLYGEPSFPGEDGCDLLGFQYEDQIFYVGNPQRTCQGDETEGDFCYKILRTWTIINWCNLNDTLNSRVELDPQVFYIKDDTKPFIIPNPNFNHEEKEKFCSFDPSCGPTTILISRRGNVRPASCSTQADLEWHYCLTDEDGNTVMNGQVDGRDLIIEKELPIGTYILDYALYDMCGNVQSYQTTVVVEYCKAPTAYCLNGLAVSLNEHGNVELWASDFARDVNSDCIDGVALSFSATDLDMKNITLCCEDVGIVTVDIFFTSVDGDGNIPEHGGEEIIRQSVCTSMISVQDNGQVCGGDDMMGCDAKVNNVVQNGNRALISGSISRPDNVMVSDVQVKLQGSESSVTTDDEGYYAFPNMPIGGQYIVKPEMEGIAVTGVSTLDLVLIQKHILGLRNLETPYTFIAADINNDQNVSALDIVSLRKVILGLTETFPNNDIWNFINKDYVFFDEENPLASNYDDEYEISDLSQDMDIHFLAVKTGDVNFSAELNGVQNAEARSSEVFTISLGSKEKFSEGLVTMPFVSAQNIELNGYQFTIDFDGSTLNFKDVKIGDQSVMTDQNFGIHAKNGKVTVSWHSGSLIEYSSGETLFSLEFLSNASGAMYDAIAINSSITKAEAYIGEQVLDVALSSENTQYAISGLELYQNLPNPFTNNTEIKFGIPQAGDVSFTVHSLTGQIMYQINKYYDAGSHSIALNKQDLDYAGVLYYTVEFAGDTQTKQMIIID